MAVALESGFPVVGGQDSGTGTAVTVSGITTAGPSLLVVMLIWQNDGTQTLSPVALDGAGLNWTKRAERVCAGSFPGAQVVQAWSAGSSAALSGVSITATRTGTTTNNTVAIAVYSFTGAWIGTQDSFTQDASAVAARTATGTAAGSYTLGVWGGGASTTEFTLRGDTTRDRTGSNATATSRVNAGRASATSSGGNVTVGATNSVANVGALVLEVSSAPAQASSSGPGPWPGVFSGRFDVVDAI